MVECDNHQLGNCGNFVCQPAERVPVLCFEATAWGDRKWNLSWNVVPHELLLLR